MPNRQKSVGYKKSFKIGRLSFGMVLRKAKRGVPQFLAYKGGRDLFVFCSLSKLFGFMDIVWF
jgi:hypothetical protein